MNYTVSLTSEGDSIAMRTIGGKGYNLVVLAHSGFLVPSAFIISEEAFREFRNSWNLNLDINNEEDITDERIEEIQKRFKNYKLNYELTGEIQTQLHDLQYRSPIPNPLLAVRSSSVEEDLEGASLAGINETVLNVHCDIDSVCDAVLRCWASLYSRSSIQYRIRHGFPALKTSIAVVVQIMIPSECSGVVFTADPKTQSRAHMYIDSVQGMGGSLVSGQVNPDHWLIRKPYGYHDYIIEKKEINKQEFKLVSNYPSPGTTKVILDDTQSQQPSLSDVQNKHKMKEVIETIINLEKYYQQHLDIEFAYFSNKLYILQARPMTQLISLPQCVNPLIHPNEAEFCLFFGMQTLISSEAVSPMEFSLLQRLAGSFDSLLLYINGHIFFDMAVFLTNSFALHFVTEKLNNRDSNLLKGYQELIRSHFSNYSHQKHARAASSLKRLFFRPILQQKFQAVLPMKRLILWKQRRNAPGLMKRLRDAETEIQRICDEKKDDVKIGDILGIPINCVELLSQFFVCAKWLRKFDKKLMREVKNCGIPEKEAELLWPNLAQFRNLECSRQLKSLRNSLQEAGWWEKAREVAGNPEKTAEWLNSLHSAEDPKSGVFLSEFGEFMSAFGYSTMFSLDVLTWFGSWREMIFSSHESSALVLKLLVESDETPVPTEEERENLRKSKIDEILGNPEIRSKSKVKSAVENFREYSALIEGFSSSLTHCLALYRQVLRTEGKRLAGKGVLDRTEDIAFLTLDELLWFEQNPRGDLKDAVESGKGFYLKGTQTEPPKSICMPECIVQVSSGETPSPLIPLKSTGLMGPLELFSATTQVIERIRSFI